MTIIEISRDEYFKRLDSPHNPPDDSVTDAEFDAEYYSLFNKLEPLMAEHGTNNAFEQGDYYLEPGIKRSRGLGFEITNDAIVTKELLCRLQGLVAMNAPNWELYLGSNAFLYGIFVGADEIRIHRRDSEVLAHIRANDEGCA